MPLLLISFVAGAAGSCRHRPAGKHPVPLQSVHHAFCVSRGDCWCAQKLDLKISLFAKVFFLIFKREIERKKQCPNTEGCELASVLRSPPLSDQALKTQHLNESSIQTGDMKMIFFFMSPGLLLELCSVTTNPGGQCSFFSPASPLVKLSPGGWRVGGLEARILHLVIIGVIKWVRCHLPLWK